MDMNSPELPKSAGVSMPEMGAEMPQLAMQHNTGDAMLLAHLIYAEGAGEKDDFKTMVGSTALNRLEANRPEEFGSSLGEVGFKGFSSVTGDKFSEAASMSFKDKTSENAWKRSYQIANGLLRGTIKRQKGQFFHTPKEIAHNTRKKSFNYKAVKTIGTIKSSKGPFKVMSY
jgi:spore germination cell wall hydrolase CwlJ-like protein